MTDEIVYCTNPSCPQEGRPFSASLEVMKEDSFGEVAHCPFCDRASTREYVETTPVFTVYTDGSCPKNGVGGEFGPGGYAAVFLKGLDADFKDPFDSKRLVKTVTGGALESTNNRMELGGIIAALTGMDRFCRLEIVSDSQYCVNGCSGWIKGWIKRGWVNSQGKPVANRDLWEQIHELLKQHDATFRWVKGHRGHRWNELADQLAGEACQAQVLPAGSA